MVFQRVRVASALVITFQPAALCSVSIRVARVNLGPGGPRVVQVVALAPLYQPLFPHVFE